MLPGHLIWRSCTETLRRDLLQRSCQEVSYISLAKRTLIEILYRDLARTPHMETLYRDIAQRSIAEILPRGLLHKSCQERDLAKRSLTEIARRPLIQILYRELVKRAEVLPRVHVQIVWTEILLWDPLQRCFVISLRHLVQIALHRDLAQQPRNLSRKSCARSATEIFTKGACRILLAISSSRDHLEWTTCFHY